MTGETMRAVRIHAPGGTEALALDDVAIPAPGAGEALVRLDVAGVNFIDVYKRTGLYPVPLPSTLGEEGAGTVIAVGPDVTTAREGDRVAWASVLGAYADYAVVPAAKLVPLPSEVGTSQAAALMLQGMTAHYLATSAYPIRDGDVCLVHAAAGGVGLLLVQMAKRRGARVIGTAGSAEKAALARAAGADETILYREVDFAAETRRLTGGAGANVVYDSVGRSTFLAGLGLLRPRGTMVLFGQSSGSVEPFDPQLLARNGSLFLTRPVLGHYIATRAELLGRAEELFRWVGAGELSVRVGAEFPLAQVADAHAALEGRRTTGKVLLRIGG